jgi:hypothetical protein
MKMQGTVMLVLMQYLSPDAWEVTWMKRIENNTSTSTVQKFSSVFLMQKQCYYLLLCKKKKTYTKRSTIRPVLMRLHRH